ncbi:MAG: EMC3/TMCO1 family protein [Candidatus Heimdallarchaeaceae archaeon]|jgi:uncharacterized membrane protein (DUF106 family)
MAFWDSWFQAIADWITGNGWNDFPYSAVSIALISIIIAIISTTITRLATNVDDLKESMQKVNDWNQRRKKAMQTADKKLWLSVKRDEERIKKMQSSMMFKRMKPMLFTTIPFLVIFAILRVAFPSNNCDVAGIECHNYAWLPFNIGEFPWIGGSGWTQQTEWPAGSGKFYSKVSFTLWYFISAFAFGSLISRVFGVTPSGATQTKKKPKDKQRRTPTSVTKEKLAKSKQEQKKETASK